MLKYPLIQGGMGVGISMGGLAGAVAREGGMGVISTANIGFREDDFWTNPREANKRALVKEIQKAREISLGKGMIAINAMVATSNYDEAVKTACEAGIDAVISGAGLPVNLPALAEGYDCLIAPIVSGKKAAKVLARLWKKHNDRAFDFVVVEGNGAGGHLGFSEEEVLSEEPKSIFELATEVKEEVGEIPVFCAGSVFDRQDLEKAKKAGASGVQMGTRFIATHECDASEGFKDVILEAKSEDLAVFKSPVGMPARGIKTPLIENVLEGNYKKPEKCIRCIKTCDPANTPYCITKALIDAYYGKKETGLFFAGSNVEKVTEITGVSHIFGELFGQED